MSRNNTIRGHTSPVLNLCVHSSQNEAKAIQDRTDFDLFDATLRRLVDGLALGQVKLAIFISKESQAVQSHVSHEVSRSQFAVTSQIGAHVKETEAALSGQMQLLSISRERREAQERFLLSLRFPGMAEREVTVREAASSTYEWIFSSSMQQWSDFSSWLKSDESIYWVSGKPGSGKSTLMKFLASHERTSELLRPDSIVLSHYFWRPGVNLQKSIRGLLLTLLYQILDQDRSLMDLLLAHSKKMEYHDWSFPLLNSSLQTVLEKCGRPVCIFIDGLDEIDPSDGPFELINLLENLYQAPHVKACLSSRPEPVFQKKFEGLPRLRLQDLTKLDMERVCHQRLDIFHEEIPPDWEYENCGGLDGLVNILVVKAEGVFLWVHLVLQSIRRGFANGDTMEDILSRVEKLPEDLDDLYYDMWKRVNVDRGIYERVGARMLNLVLDSGELGMDILKHNRSMSVFELMLALSPPTQTAILQGSPIVPEELRLQCEAVKRKVETHCCGLVEIMSSINDENKPQESLFEAGPAEFDTPVQFTDATLNFVHRSAVDFLSHTDRGNEILSTDDSTFSDRMTSLHISAMAMLKMWRYSPWPSSYSFFTIAGVHYRRAWSLFRGIAWISKSISEDAHRQLALASENLWTGGVCPILIPDLGLRISAAYLDDFMGYSASTGNLDMIRSKIQEIEASTGRKIGPRYLAYLLQRCFLLDPDGRDEIRITSLQLDIADWAIDRRANSNVPFIFGYNHMLPLHQPYHVATALQGLVFKAILIGREQGDGHLALFGRLCQMMPRMLDESLDSEKRLVVRLSWLVGLSSTSNMHFYMDREGGDNGGPPCSQYDCAISLSIANLLEWFSEFIGTVHLQQAVPAPVARLGRLGSDEPLRLLIFKIPGDNWRIWRRPTEKVLVPRKDVWTELKRLLSDKQNWRPLEALQPVVALFAGRVGDSVTLETPEAIEEALGGIVAADGQARGESLYFAYPTPSHFD